MKFWEGFPGLMFFASAGLMNAQTVTTSGTSSGAGWAWIPPVVGLLCGGLLIWMSIVNGRKAKASLAWPSAPGTVVSSVLVQDTTGEITTFTPVVTYTYVVNGQTLQCDRVGFSPTRNKKILAKYPKGNPVQVFFDPQHPSTAVLEKGGSTRVMMFVGIAVIAGSWLVGILIGSL
jgi:hypothetical protein